MKDFMDKNFLLNSKTARILFHDYAEDMPVYDYHCHLNPKEIAEDKKFKNITEIWLKGDHYKWRLMRICGVGEKFITGDADDKEKFLKYAEVLPNCMGNPIYHWTHLELQRYFDIYKPLTPKTAEEIWDKCNKLLAKNGFSVREIIKKSNVKVICTTDDPVDDLAYHKAIAEIKNFKTKVVPSFRPDKAINIEKQDFKDWIRKLQEVSGASITSYKQLISVLDSRVEYFHLLGCRVSDHALDTVPFKQLPENDISEIFSKAFAGQYISKDEIEAYKTDIILKLASMYNSRGWIVQLHIGVMRNVNYPMFSKLGPDTGFDAIGDDNFASQLASLLNAMEMGNGLPKTVLYTINSVKNEVLSSLVGAFSASVPGKIQFGTAWWFNDHISGMKSQLRFLSEMGVLGKFIGMLTDSRSFLSYARHEYFRRILCDMIGTWIENGELHYDIDFYGKLVKDICFNNAVEYFPVELK